MGFVGATDNEAAKSFFRRAIDLDSSFAAAHAQLAIAILFGSALYQTMSVAKSVDEALPVAQKAIALDPLGAAGYNSMASARFFQGDHEGMLTAVHQALAVSPNYALAHHQLGVALLFSGQPREAFEPIRKAMRLDPHDPLRINRLSQTVIAHYFLREYQAATETAKEVLRAYPDHPTAYRWLAASLGQAGRFDEAKQTLEKAIAVNPKSFDMFVRQRFPGFRVEDYEHMVEGLRKAGWED
jgi:adenylate cyclase